MMYNNIDKSIMLDLLLNKMILVKTGNNFTQVAGYSLEKLFNQLKEKDKNNTSNIKRSKYTHRN